MILSPRSLRGRLVLGAVTVGVSFAIAFGVAATWRVNQAQDRAVHAALLSRTDLARDEVAADGVLNQDAGSPKTDLVQVVGPDGSVRSASAALRGAGPLVDVADVRGSGSGVERTLALRRPNVELSVRAVPLEMRAHGTSPGGTGALVTAVDAEGFRSVTSDLRGLLVIGLLAVVLAMGLLAWFVAGRALRNVTRLTESAETVETRDLATGLPSPPRDVELARLVAALNRMLVRLHDSHATELAFAADAGHRLRTPVATLRAEAELALREDDPREKTAALARIVQDADQLASIVDRMLARTRERDYAPEPAAAALLAAAPRWRRQAELAGVELRVNGVPSVDLSTCCRAITETVEPIVDNAIRHTPADGAVVVDVRRDPAARTLVVDVSNTGSPVPAELAGRLFDAWVSSRDASVAGGLGLWLARETARDSGGDVSLLRSDDARTTFRVVLPLVPDGSSAQRRKTTYL